MIPRTAKENKLIGEELAGREQELSKLQPYSSNDPLAQLRTFREEVKRAAKDGKDTILIPSGETAMKIEGLGSRENWYNVRDSGHVTSLGSSLAEADLKVGKPIIQQGTGGETWIITDILGDGKFKAVPKDVYESMEFGNEFTRGVRNIAQEETFDISGKVDTKHFVYKLNEEAIPREARKMGLNVEGKVKEGQGEYWKIKLPKERGRMPVEAFGVVPIGLGLNNQFGSQQSEEEIPTETSNVIKPQSSFEARRVGGTLFGELSSPGNEEEARDILSTIVNRAQQKGVSLQQVITEPSQYDAYRGTQYMNYMSGKLDYPSKKKAEIVDKLIKELMNGTFEPTTDMTGFKHNGPFKLDNDFGQQ